MIVYDYNPETGEYNGIGEAQESPLEPGVYLIPAHATTIAPPEAGAGHVAVFADGAWTLVEDHRGEIYYDTVTQERHEIKNLGVVPETWTQSEPTDRETVWNGVAWKIPFAVLKERKLTELSADFNRRIGGSVVTSQGYIMQFNISDILKMQGATALLEAQGAETGYITQADDTTVYDVPLATIKAVQGEMMQAWAACHARKQELRALITATETEEALNAIVISWPV